MPREAKSSRRRSGVGRGRPQKFAGPLARSPEPGGWVGAGEDRRSTVARAYGRLSDHLVEADPDTPIANPANGGALPVTIDQLNPDLLADVRHRVEGQHRARRREVDDLHAMSLPRCSSIAVALGLGMRSSSRSSTSRFALRAIIRPPRLYLDTTHAPLTGPAHPTERGLRKGCREQPIQQLCCSSVTGSNRSSSICKPQ